MSRHTYVILYEDGERGRRFRVRTYVQATSTDEALAHFSCVKVLRCKEVAR